MELLTERQAAELLKVSQAFLQRDRWWGPTIEFVRIGGRSVRYDRASIERYIAARRVEMAT